MAFARTLLGAAAMLACAASFKLEGRVWSYHTPTGNDAASKQLQLLNAAALSSAVDAVSARVVLNAGERSTFAAKDGAFSFDDVPDGIYTVEIFHPHATYSTYRVQVAGEGAVVLEYKYPGAPKWPSTHPIVARPVAVPAYFEASPSTTDTLLGFAKSPMIIMFAVMGVLMLCMRGMDPETMAAAQREQQEAMREMGVDNPMALMGKLLSGGGAADPAPGPARAAGAGRGAAASDANPVLRQRPAAAAAAQ